MKDYCYGEECRSPPLGAFVGASVLCGQEGPIPALPGLWLSQGPSILDIPKCLFPPPTPCFLFSIKLVFFHVSIMEF